MSRIVVGATLAIVFGANALAQNAVPTGRPGPHTIMNGPCAADLAKYCKGVQPGQHRLIDCLEAHEARLAPACHTGLAGLFGKRTR